MYVFSISELCNYSINLSNAADLDLDFLVNSTVKIYYYDTLSLSSTNKVFSAIKLKKQKRHFSMHGSTVAVRLQKYTEQK